MCNACLLFGCPVKPAEPQASYGCGACAVKPSEPRCIAIRNSGTTIFTNNFVQAMGVQPAEPRAIQNSQKSFVGITRSRNGNYQR